LNLWWHQLIRIRIRIGIKFWNLVFFFEEFWNLVMLLKCHFFFNKSLYDLVSKKSRQNFKFKECWWSKMSFFKYKLIVEFFLREVNCWIYRCWKSAIILALMHQIPSELCKVTKKRIFFFGNKRGLTPIKKEFIEAKIIFSLKFYISIELECLLP